MDIEQRLAFMEIIKFVLSDERIRDKIGFELDLSDDYLEELNKEAKRQLS